MKRFALLAAALAAFALTRFQPTDPVGAAPPAFGWVPDPASADAFRRALPAPHFSDTPAYRAAGESPDDVFLWDACRKVTGAPLPARNQGGVGACVGFGTASAVEHLICVQLANGAPGEFRPLAPEVVYAGSRVEIGGGRIPGDGSVGAWAARFVREYGVAARGVYGPLDLSRYSERLCRSLGSTGLPADVKGAAKRSPVRAVSGVTRWAEARAAVANGYPVAVCSSQGFRMGRDADGFGVPQGTWMHCMALVGVCGGRRPGGFLLNSWGDAAHPGPRGPGDPPACGFWADAAVLDRMLRQGDSWAFSEFAGFPARKLDWYAGAPDAQRPGLTPVNRRSARATEGSPLRGLGGGARLGTPKG